MGSSGGIWNLRDGGALLHFIYMTNPCQLHNYTLQMCSSKKLRVTPLHAIFNRKKT